MLRRRRFEHLARIRVVGVGDGGITAVNAMIDDEIKGVDYITVDSDPRALKRSRAIVSFAVPAGAQASDGLRELEGALHGSDMVFVVGGLGGKTGTRLAADVAALARAEGALTTAIMTAPFSFEGPLRASAAERGVERLRNAAHTLVVIPNDRLLALAGGTVAFHQTYDLALSIWQQSVRGISELVNAPGLVNVDFADVRTIMSGGGPSIIAMGSSRGANRARRAAQQVVSSPFLDVTIDGAQGVLFNISGGPDMTLHEVRQAAAVIRERSDPDVNLIFGAAVDESLGDELRITLIATGCGFTRPTIDSVLNSTASVGTVVKQAVGV